MKYQRQLAVVGLIVVAGAGLYALRNFLAKSGGFNVRDVTSTKKEGGISTTPIKTSDVAVAAPASTLQLIVGGARAAATKVVRSFVPAAPSSSKLQPFQNATAAKAAYKAPLRPETRPSAWASIKPR